jgi:hypothetical protein
MALFPACTSLLGTFEIGDVATGSSTGSSSGSGGSGGGSSGTSGSSGSGGQGGDPTSSTGVGSAGSGTPLTVSAAVPGPSNFAHAAAVSARKGVAAVGGSFTGHLEIGMLSVDCTKAASCAFVSRFDFSQSGGASPPWLIRLEGTGAADTAEILGVAVDSKGFTYVVGRYSGSLTVNGSSSLTKFSDGLQHGFMIQLNPTAGPDWALENSVSAPSAITSVAIDPQDDVLIGGDFTGSVDIGTCMPLTTAPGKTSSFVIKLGAKTSACLWSTGLFGTDVKLGAIASDFGGNALVTGSHAAMMKIGGAVVLPATTSGAEDLYAAKLDTTQSGKPLWLRDIKASKSAAGVGIVPVQGPGPDFGVVVAGKLDGKAFAGTPCAITAASTGASSVVARLDNAKGDCVWSKTFAGQSASLAADGNSDLAVTGSFVGSTQYDATSALTSGPGKATFITKLKSAAGELLWSRGFIVQNPGESVIGRSVSGDASGNWFLVGTLDGTADFGVGPPLTTASGSFLVRLGN